MIVVRAWVHAILVHASSQVVDDDNNNATEEEEVVVVVHVWGAKSSKVSQPSQPSQPGGLLGIDFARAVARTK